MRVKELRGTSCGSEAAVGHDFRSLSAGPPQLVPRSSLIVVGERGQAGAGEVRTRLRRALPRAVPTGNELAFGAELLSEHGLAAELDRLVAGGEPVDDGSDDLRRLAVSREPEFQIGR